MKDFVKGFCSLFCLGLAVGAGLQAGRKLVDSTSGKVENAVNRAYDKCKRKSKK